MKSPKKLVRKTLAGGMSLVQIEQSLVKQLDKIYKEQHEQRKLLRKIVKRLRKLEN